MSKVFLGILREIGIALIIIVVFAAVTVFAFKDQLPYDEKVPQGEEYVKANMKTYSVSSTDRISEISAVTVTHEANAGQIIDAENKVRIQTGKYTPFGTIDSTTDIPTERVGVSVAISESDDDNNSSSDETSNENKNENMDYPLSEDEMNLVNNGETETSEEAAQRRMGNVE
ncbi:MAG: hypothetical protein IJ220_07225 [Clostridia bacterium]|nr:hypothetical protein [Clostridia bacterium]